MKRLLETYQKHHNLIVAIDFDDTIKNYHPNDTCNLVVELIKRVQSLGFSLILFTCRENERLDEAIKYLHSIGIYPDSVNESVIVPFESSRKPYYNILLDDKAGLGEAYEILKEVIDIIEK